MKLPFDWLFVSSGDMAAKFTSLIKHFQTNFTLKYRFVSIFTYKSLTFFFEILSEGERESAGFINKMFANLLSDHIT
jgi:hypothetical protein